MPIFVPLSATEIHSTPRKAAKDKRESKPIDATANSIKYEEVGIDDM